MTQWGNIIDHDGGPCPLPEGQPIRVWMTDGHCHEGRLTLKKGVYGWDWSGPSCPATLAHVLAYQLPRPARVRMVCDLLSEMAQVGAQVAARLVSA